jgi:hypothetical protein
MSEACLRYSRLKIGEINPVRPDQSPLNCGKKGREMSQRSTQKFLSIAAEKRERWGRDRLGCSDFCLKRLPEK